MRLLSLTIPLILWTTHVAVYVSSVPRVNRIPARVWKNFGWSAIAGLPLTMYKWDLTKTVSDDVFNVGRCIVLHDLLFYGVHRLMHTKWLYRFHSHHHQHVAVFADIAFDATPLEHVFANVLPVVLLGIYCQLSLYGMYVWIFLATWGSVTSHDGQTSNHAEHHRRQNCNFGSGFMLLDRAMGTFRRVS